MNHAFLHFYFCMLRLYTRSWEKQKIEVFNQFHFGRFPYGKTYHQSKRRSMRPSSWSMKYLMILLRYARWSSFCGLGSIANFYWSMLLLSVVIIWRWIYLDISGPWIYTRCYPHNIYWHMMPITTGRFAWFFKLFFKYIIHNTLTGWLVLEFQFESELTIGLISNYIDRCEHLET